MLKIKNLNIEINTKEKKFGRYVEFFTDGLTIIRGDNHSGKTTIASSIFYALGMEELLGGRNTVALDSILTTSIPYGGLDLNIVTSSVSIEIENTVGDTAVLKRFIKHYDIEHRIIEVTDKNGSEFYFLHDGGSAKHEQGFYKYLEGFLGVSLPTVPKFEEGDTKLYLQVVFNAFFIEQIKGWTDFFAAIPNFGIKDAKKRIVEYLLNLNTFEYEVKRSEYDTKKLEITNKWNSIVTTMQDKAKLVSGNIKNLAEKVCGEELYSKKSYLLTFLDNDKEYTVDEYLSYLLERANELRKSENSPKSEIDTKILKLKQKLNQSFAALQELKQQIAAKRNEKDSLVAEKNRILNEIESITYLQKIEKYTKSAVNTNKLFKGVCPTCNSKIPPSLYETIEIMGLKDNKEYLISQKDIVATYINIVDQELSIQSISFNQVEAEYEADKKIVKYLEKDLETDTNAPSYGKMKELILIEDKIERIDTVKKDLVLLESQLTETAKAWDENERVKEPFEMSFSDKSKLDLLESSFKQLLKEFLYGSKRDDQIWIARSGNTKYFPMIKIGDDKAQQIRFNSSASDFVRSIWAYIIALYEVSSHKNGNHLGILLFDEPAQHAMTETSQSALFQRLSKLGCQSIVFASFENEEKTVQDKFSVITEGIENMKVVTIKDRAIMEIV